MKIILKLYNRDELDKIFIAYFYCTLIFLHSQHRCKITDARLFLI